MKLWGSMRLDHWSEMKLPKRAELLGHPFQEIYESVYKQLSWHVHGGLAGVMSVEPQNFPYLFGISCQIAGYSYLEILKAAIKEFKLSDPTPTIYKELEFAKIRAAVKGADHEANLRKGFGLS